MVEILKGDGVKAQDIVITDHSVKLDFKPGTVIRFDGQEYHFLQAHFHTVSEHQLDGITYPMDIHFMSMTNQQDEIKDAGYLEENPVYVNDLLRPEEPFNDYYYYRGSLTTTPYTESVNWVIMKRVLEASPEQIQKINVLEGNNARHVHALYSRTIESN